MPPVCFQVPLCCAYPIRIRLLFLHYRWVCGKCGYCTSRNVALQMVQKKQNGDVLDNGSNDLYYISVICGDSLMDWVHRKAGAIRCNVRCDLRCRNIKKPMDPNIRGGLHNVCWLLMEAVILEHTSSLADRSHSLVSLNGASQTDAQLTSVTRGIWRSLAWIIY
jgi:hypothetical protein